MKTLTKKIFSGTLNTTLLMVVVGLFGAYSFFIGHSVIAINQRKALMGQVRTTQSDVSNSEIKYFNLASGIDMNTVSKLGFVDSQTPDFAYTQQTGQDTVAVR
jgi:hypothetical protein